VVFEAFYNISVLQKKPKLAILLGFVYACVGIGLAHLLFPNSSGLASVAFTSLLILPSFTNIVFLEEETEREGRRIGLFALIRDNRSAIRILLNIFIGSFFAYLFVSLMFPSYTAPMLFEPQLRSGGISGNAIISAALFNEIFVNNLIVLAVCFLLSFFIGSGGIFFIIWNSSAWGVFFGNTAAVAAGPSHSNQILYVVIILAVVIVFVVLEALAYIMATLAGSVLSRSVLDELKSRGLTVFHKYASIMGVVSPKLSHRLLEERWYAEGFTKVLVVNISLLALSALIIFAAALIESVLLGNVSIYREIVLKSMGV